MKQEELISNVLWECIKCHRQFIDEDAADWTEWHRNSSTYPIEPKLYWLGINEPVCEECAIESGIPPIDAIDKE